jgi:hypothetical protein
MGIFNKDRQFMVRGSFFERVAKEVVSSKMLYNVYKNLIQMPNNGRMLLAIHRHLNQ